MNDKLLLKNTKMNQINSVTRGKMRQLSYYEFENQRGCQSVKYIRKMTKRSHDWNEKGYLSCAICLFLVAAAFLMSSEIY